METATLADVCYLQARLVRTHGKEIMKNGTVELQVLVIDIVAARTGPAVRGDGALAKTPDNAVNTTKEEAEVLEQGGGVVFELGEKHGVAKGIRREIHNSLTTLFHLRRADVPDLPSLTSSAMSSTRKELVRLGLRDATATLSPAERKVVVYLYLEQKAERYDTVTERVKVNEGSIAMDIAGLKITSASSSGQSSVQVARASYNPSYDRPTQVRRSYYGRASAFGRLASSVAAFRAHYDGLWPVTYVTRVLTLLWGVAYQPSGHLFYDHPAALMGPTPFSCLATERLRAAARALASQSRSPSPPLPATSLPAAVELPTLRELFFDSELPGAWCRALNRKGRKIALGGGGTLGHAQGGSRRARHSRAAVQQLCRRGSRSSPCGSVHWRG